MLVGASQRMNLKLRDLARRLAGGEGGTGIRTPLIQPLAPGDDVRTS
jgi:hypothetical protein